MPGVESAAMGGVVGLVVANVTPPATAADPWTIEFHDGSGIAFYFPAGWAPPARAARLSASPLLAGDSQG